MPRKHLLEDRIIRALHRFFSQWEQDENGCHVWQGSLDPDGYGQMLLKGYFRRAHRAAWWFKHGSFPEGLVINHTCRNRACVNIAHLEMVTPEVNMAKDSLHWMNLPTCRQGHKWDGYYIRSANGYKIRTCSICRNNAKRKRRAHLRELGLPAT